jgi:DNA-binding transcriptional ArsR family regulator
VLVKAPKYRRPISLNQDKILKILFKFRFVSCDLLAKCLDKDRSTAYENLYVLVNQGYVIKKYDSSYRFRLRPAIYYLAAKGVRYLLDNSQLNPSTLKGMYQNGSKDDEHIDRHLLVMRLSLAIRRLYPGQFDSFTKTELAGYNRI